MNYIIMQTITVPTVSQQYGHWYLCTQTSLSEKCVWEQWDVSLTPQVLITHLIMILYSYPDYEVVEFDPDCELMKLLSLTLLTTMMWVVGCR